MELTLNLAWMLLATLMLGLWMRYAPREGAPRVIQLVALVVVILILFPAISVTDDLLAAQGLAETDGCPRKGHDCIHPHSAPQTAQTFFLQAIAVLYADSTRTTVTDSLPASLVRIPALASIQNRPPPPSESISRPSCIS